MALNTVQKIECKQARLDMLRDIRTLCLAKGASFDINKARKMCSKYYISQLLEREESQPDANYPRLRDELIPLWYGRLK